MATTTIASGSTPSEQSVEHGRARRARSGHSASLIAGTVCLLLLVVFALMAPAFGDPKHQDLTAGLDTIGNPLSVGSPGYPLGSDSLGRDQLARLASGARVSLIAASVSTVTSLLLGTIIGLFAGFYRGVIETVLMRLTDVALAIPYMLGALVIASLMSPGIGRVIVIITALFWAYPARLVYSETLRLRKRSFVEASEAAGASGANTIRRHLLPHITSLVLSYAPIAAAFAVVFEATLSFLGAGVSPPTASWGNMIAEGQDAISYAPHLLIEPAIMIFVCALGFLLIGEGLKKRTGRSGGISWLGI